MTAIAAGGVRWRLGARTRKSVLVLHIASAGAWLGIDVGTHPRVRHQVTGRRQGQRPGRRPKSLRVLVTS